MNKLRVAVVGVGYLGKFHAQKYAARDDVDLVGVVDVDEKQAGAVARDCGTRAFSDHRELLGKVDAVSVAVPTPAHFPVAENFLENDVDVLIEKPMTTTIKEADALIDIAESRGLIIQVGHLERFNPAVLALGNVVRRPLFIEAHRLSTFKPRATDVSVVLDLMIHDIDIILNFVDSEISEIRAAGVSVVSDHVDIANARIEFENGCVANVTASRISRKDERKLRLFQKDAYISIDFANRRITVIRPATGGGGPIPGVKTTESNFEQADALAAEIAAFVDCVKKRKAPQVNGPVARKALHTALTVMEKIKKTSSRIKV